MYCQYLKTEEISYSTSEYFTINLYELLSLNQYYTSIYWLYYYGLGHCEISEYRCADGTCIPEMRICDRLVDCLDGADEEQCENGNDL